MSEWQRSQAAADMRSFADRAASGAIDVSMSQQEMLELQEQFGRSPPRGRRPPPLKKGEVIDLTSDNEAPAGGSSSSSSSSKAPPPKKEEEEESGICVAC